MRGVSTILREYAYADIGITSIFLMDQQGQVLDPLYITQPYSNIIYEYDALINYQLGPPSKKFSIPSHFPSKLEGRSGDKTTITFFDTYLSKLDYSERGTMLITAKLDYLFQDFKNAAKSKFDTIYIIDENGHDIFTYGSPFPREKLDQVFNESNIENGILNFDKNSYYYNLRTLESYPNWTVVGIVSYDKLRIEIKSIWNLLFVISAFGIMIIAATSYVLSSKITDPILQLGNSMKQVEKGYWPDPIVPETVDELKDLIEGFNSMVEEQQNLIEQIYDEEQRKKELEVSALQMKLDLLQSQINPHFIHNTLNAIQYTIMADRIEDASHMLKAFNMLLRASMSQDKDFITIREELDCLISYVDIQKIRYDNTFDINIHIDPELYNVKVPKLLLQPIVENSIFHGIVPKGEPGIIDITIERVETEKVNDDTLILITIKDDGVGMSDTDIKNLIKDSDSAYKGSFNRISFKNINNRLLLAYGNKEGLQIESSTGQGTKVSFTMPIQ